MGFCYFWIHYSKIKWNLNYVCIPDIVCMCVMVWLVLVGTLGIVITIEIYHWMQLSIFWSWYLIKILTPTHHHFLHKLQPPNQQPQPNIPPPTPLLALPTHNLHLLIPLQIKTQHYLSNFHYLTFTFTFSFSFTLIWM